MDEEAVDEDEESIDEAAVDVLLLLLLCNCCNFAFR